MDQKCQNYKFSIVVPCYNEEDAVEQTIKEILDTLDNWKKKKEVKLFFEMIFINDGSKDKTSSVLFELAKKYSKLTIIDSAINCGYGASLKKEFSHQNMIAS